MQEIRKEKEKENHSIQTGIDIKQENFDGLQDWKFNLISKAEENALLIAYYVTFDLLICIYCNSLHA